MSFSQLLLKKKKKKKKPTRKIRVGKSRIQFIKKNNNNTKVNSYSQETFLAVTPSTAGWYRTALSREGVCVVCYVPKASRGFPRLGTF